MIQCTEKIDFYTKITESQAKQETISVVTTSYKEGKYIESFCGFMKENSRFYAAEENDLPDEIKNINETVKQLKVLMYTSTISSGVNIHIKQFDKMFVYITPKSNHARDIKQMIGRIRNLNCKEIYYFIAPQVGYKPDTYEKVKLCINNNLSVTNMNSKEVVYDFISSTDIHRKRIQNTYKFYIKENIWIHLAIQSIAEKNRSWNNMQKEFESVMLPQGYQHSTMNCNRNKHEIEQFKIYLNEIKTAYKENKLTEWKNARILEGDLLKQHESLVHHNIVTKNQKIEVNKAHLINKFQENTPIDFIEPLFADKHNTLLNKIYAVYAEIKYNRAQILTIDNQNNNNLYYYDKYKITKVPIVDRVCSILQIQNSMDINTLIDQNNIIPYCNEIFHSYTIWRKVFEFRCKSPDIKDFKFIVQCMQVLRSIIKDWSGYNITKYESNSGTNFKLKPPIDNFTFLVNSLKSNSNHETLITHPLQIPQIPQNQENLNSNNQPTVSTSNLLNYYPTLTKPPLTLHIISQ